MGQRHGGRDDQKRLEMLEKIYLDVSLEIDKEYENERKSFKLTHRNVCDINDGEELWHYLESSNDMEVGQTNPHEVTEKLICRIVNKIAYVNCPFQVDLTMTQKRSLENYKTKVNEERMNRIDRIVKEKLSESTQRKSSSMLKIRLIDANDPKPNKSPILIIWNAGEAHSALRENMLVDMQSVIANGMRGKDIQLTSGKYTTIREAKCRPSAAVVQYKRKITHLAEIDGHHFRPHFNEFDTLGFCFEMDESKSGQFQAVYIADSHKNILCLKFWNGVEEYAYDDIVRVGKFLMFSNLDWRSQRPANVNGILQAFATEFTICSEYPKADDRKAILDHQRDEFKVIDLDEFTSECCDIIRNINSNTPLRPSSSSFNRTAGATNRSQCSSTPVDAGKRLNTSSSRLVNESLSNEVELPLLQGYYASTRATKTPLRRSLGGSRFRRTPKTSQKENQGN